MYTINKLFSFLMDEAGDSGSGGGGGGDVDISVDIGAASDAIGADLGLNEGEGTDVLLDGSATPPAKKPDEPKNSPGSGSDDAAAQARAKAAAAAERTQKLAAAKGKLAADKVDFTGKTDDEILALVEPKQPKAPPKSWKAEMHPHFSKLPPEVQDYMIQREAEVEQGFIAQSEAAKYGKALKDIFTPYQPIFDAQGVDHATGVKFLLNAHYVLSTSDAPKRAQYFAQLAKSYGVDLTAAVAAAGAPPAQETPEMKELRERTERLEQQQKKESTARYEALKAEADREVAAFAADPAHPYWKEVQAEVALLLQDPKITLAQAYEMAVYANPVTRAKELARLQKEAEDKTRKEAEAAAAAAEKARGTRVRGNEKEKESPSLLGSMEDTMRETMATIRHRTD